MYHRRLPLLFGLLILTFVLLVGCSPDCEWSTAIQTWVDRNENGIWDDDESPLPNVTSIVESFESVGIAEATSDEKGEARLYVLLSGCPREVIFYVYVLSPPGYRVSTRSVIPVQGTDERVFKFGFVPISE